LKVSEDIAAESGKNGFTGRKTGLIIPFWLADRRSDGLGLGEMEKNTCFGDRDFWGLAGD
jgi:hypothetical protein